MPPKAKVADKAKDGDDKPKEKKVRPKKESAGFDLWDSTAADETTKVSNAAIAAAGGNIGPSVAQDKRNEKPKDTGEGVKLKVNENLQNILKEQKQDMKKAKDEKKAKEEAKSGGSKKDKEEKAGKKGGGGGDRGDEDDNTMQIFDKLGNNIDSREAEALMTGTIEEVTSSTGTRCSVIAKTSRTSRCFSNSAEAFETLGDFRFTKGYVFVQCPKEVASVDLRFSRPCTIYACLSKASNSDDPYLRTWKVLGEDDMEAPEMASSIDEVSEIRSKVIKDRKLAVPRPPSGLNTVLLFVKPDFEAEPFPPEELTQEEKDELDKKEKAERRANKDAAKVTKAKEPSKEEKMEEILAKVEKGEKLNNRDKREHERYLEKNTKFEMHIDDIIGGNLSAFSLSLEGGKCDPPPSGDAAVCENFTITAPKQTLFDNASITIVQGKRYGILGPNGQGKTTLLKHLAARLMPIPLNWDVMLVEQEAKASNRSAVEEVLAADTVVNDLLAREQALVKDLEKCEEEMAEFGDDLAWREKLREKQEELANVAVELEGSGADSSEARIRKIMVGLGFSAKPPSECRWSMERPVVEFSGGWRMRISLAKALFLQPKLLMLDEPTNHLDLDAVLWLDHYLSEEYPHSVIVVSHDADFLDNICTDILHLEDKKLVHYRGDYTAFKKMHAQKKVGTDKDFKKQQDEFKALRKKGKTNDQATEIIKQKFGIAHNEELMAKQKDYIVKFKFYGHGQDRSIGGVNCVDVGFSYNGQEPLLLEECDMGVDCGTRLTIVGPNGAGKSTFLNLMMGQLEPTKGEVTQSKGIRVKNYHQHFEELLPMEKDPTDYLMNKYNLSPPEKARSVLGQFGLPGTSHFTKIGSLSGGQKARVAFAALMLEKPHIIVLDEPTNHLDVESVEALTDAIKNFDGGVVLVTHDARLITSIDCQIYVCEGGTVYRFEKDFNGYRDKVLKELQEREDMVEAQEKKRREDRAAKREKHIAEQKAAAEARRQKQMAEEAEKQKKVEEERIAWELAHKASSSKAKKDRSESDAESGSEDGSQSESEEEAPKAKAKKKAKDDSDEEEAMDFGKKKKSSDKKKKAKDDSDEEDAVDVGKKKKSSDKKKKKDESASESEEEAPKAKAKKKAKDDSDEEEAVDFGKKKKSSDKKKKAKEDSDEEEAVDFGKKKKSSDKKKKAKDDSESESEAEAAKKKKSSDKKKKAKDDSDSESEEEAPKKKKSSDKKKKAKDDSDSESEEEAPKKKKSSDKKKKAKDDSDSESEEEAPKKKKSSDKKKKGKDDSDSESEEEAPKKKKSSDKKKKAKDDSDSESEEEAPKTKKAPAKKKKAKDDSDSESEEETAKKKKSPDKKEAPKKAPAPAKPKSDSGSDSGSDSESESEALLRMAKARAQAKSKAKESSSESEAEEEAPKPKSKAKPNKKKGKDKPKVDSDVESEEETEPTRNGKAQGDSESEEEASKSKGKKAPEKKAKGKQVVEETKEEEPEEVETGAIGTEQHSEYKVGTVLKVGVMKKKGFFLVEVDSGEETTSMVTEYPNAQEGQKIIIALEGATVNGKEFKRAKVQGEFSTGQICGPKEMGKKGGSSKCIVLDGSWKPGMSAPLDRRMKAPKVEGESSNAKKATEDLDADGGKVKTKTKKAAEKKGDDKDEDEEWKAFDKKKKEQSQEKEKEAPKQEEDDKKKGKKGFVIEKVAVSKSAAAKAEKAAANAAAAEKAGGKKAKGKDDEDEEEAPKSKAKGKKAKEDSDSEEEDAPKAKGKKAQAEDEADADPNAKHSEYKVAEVTSVEPLKKKKGFFVVEASLGDETVSIISSFANLEVGQMIIVAPEGSTVSGKEVKKAKVQGEWSSGMICGPMEMGVPGDASSYITIATSFTAGEAAPLRPKHVQMKKQGGIQINEDEDEEEEDEEDEAPRAKAPAKAPAKKKGKGNDDSEDEDEEDAPKAKGKKGAEKAPAKKKGKGNEDSEDEVEDAPKAKGKKAAAKKKGKRGDDSEDEDEEEAPKAKGKKAAEKAPAKGKPAEESDEDWQNDKKKGKKGKK